MSQRCTRALYRKAIIKKKIKPKKEHRYHVNKLKEMQ